METQHNKDADFSKLINYSIATFKKPSKISFYTNKFITKFILKGKTTRAGKNNFFKKKNEMGGIHLPAFKTYYTFKLE